MSAGAFLKKNAAFAVIGSASAVLVTRVEPFRSNFLLAIVAGGGVGVVCALVEVAARKIVKHLRR